jgi:hypothetical protein
MFKVLEEKLWIWMMRESVFVSKNHYGSSQILIFHKSGRLMLVLSVRFLSFQLFFQANSLKHVEVLEVNPDASLFRSGAYGNGLGVQHDFVFH